MPDCLELDIFCATYSAWDRDGYLTVAVDEFGVDDGSGYSSASAKNYEGHHPLGILSRPLDPVLDSQGQADPKQSTIVLRMLEGGRGSVLPLEDTRVMPLLPAIRKGETILYGSAWGQFVRLHDDGTISLYTTTTSAIVGGGKPLQLLLDPSHGSFEVVVPTGRLRLGPEGFSVQDSSGASMRIGGMSGLPAPLDKIASQFVVQAGSVDLDASIVATGPSEGVSGGAPALATPVQGIITAITTWAGAVQAALAAGTQTTDVASTLSAATAALVSSVSSLASQVPSSSTSA